MRRSMPTAVSIAVSYRCDLASIEPTELRHLGQQGAGDLVADARYADQEFLGLAPGWSNAHGNVDVVVDLCELGLQGGQHAIDGLEGLVWR